jgi:hypothetical protein
VLSTLVLTTASSDVSSKGRRYGSASIVRSRSAKRVGPVGLDVASERIVSARYEPGDEISAAAAEIHHAVTAVRAGRRVTLDGLVQESGDEFRFSRTHGQRSVDDQYTARLRSVAELRLGEMLWRATNRASERAGGLGAKPR